MNTNKFVCLFPLGFFIGMVPANGQTIHENWLESLGIPLSPLSIGLIALFFTGGMLLVISFIKYVRNRLDASLIVPVILELKANKKRSKLRAKVKIPTNNKPAKFTIYSEGGKPLQDIVVPSTKRRISVGINGLQSGKYYCDLRNSGRVSEVKWIEW